MPSTRIHLLLSSMFAIALCHFVSLAQQTSPMAASVEINGQVRFTDGGAPAENVLVRLESYDALFALSEIYLRQNKLADAEKVLMKGLAIEDHSYLGHLNLARVYWEKARTIKDLAEAKPALEKSYEEVKRALVLNPNLAGAHLLKGNLLLRVTRAADALIEFDEYLRLEPNGAFANETRALVEKIRKATSQSR